MNKPTHDETPCPLTKKNVKVHCLGVVAIVGMSLTLLSYDCGKLAHDEMPYSLWENFITYIYLLSSSSFFSFFKGQEVTSRVVLFT